jgi:hypothetical protein
MFLVILVPRMRDFSTSGVELKVVVGVGVGGIVVVNDRHLLVYLVGLASLSPRSPFGLL